MKAITWSVNYNYIEYVHIFYSKTLDAASSPMSAAIGVNLVIANLKTRMMNERKLPSLPIFFTNRNIINTAVWLL